LIYLDEHDVPYEYEAIALVHARGDDDWTDEGDMIQAMREEAAKLGAHAIIIEWIEEPGALEHVIDHLTQADTANRVGGSGGGQLLPPACGYRGNWDGRVLPPSDSANTEPR
jgi:hypothetical protein